jgi:hypothetical protein
MNDVTQARRRLLLSTAAWAGGLASAAIARRAGAFQVEVLTPTSAVGRAYANRCGGASEHAALIAKLQTQLANEPSAASLAETCPICGCPVVVNR